MKLLPFEGRYILDSTDCPKCGGVGIAPMRGSAMDPSCWSCQGTGRKPTAESLSLFYDICEGLGKPLSAEAKRGRFEPKHLSAISARQLKAGMRISLNYPQRMPWVKGWPRTVERVQHVGHGLKLTLDDRSILAITDLEVFQRELTELEVAEIQAFMAGRVGEGVVEVET